MEQEQNKKTISQDTSKVENVKEEVSEKKEYFSTVELPESAPLEAPPVNTGKKRKKKSRWAFPLGLLIFALAIIGIITIGKYSVAKIASFFDDSEQIAYYNEYLVPVVANDPVPFDDINSARPENLIDISVWALLRSNLNPDQYEYEGGYMLIPQADVEEMFKSLFGTDVKPIHQTVIGYGYEFTYDQGEMLYRIPLTNMSPIYTPRVIDISKKSSSVILTVAYISSDGWVQDTQGNFVAPSPDKYVTITLRDISGTFYLSALQARNAPETVVVETDYSVPEATLPVVINPITEEETTDENNETFADETEEQEQSTGEDEELTTTE